MVTALLFFVATVRSQEPPQTPPPVAGDDLEALLNTEVTSAARKAQPRLSTATAIYVITGEEIRRAGATTLADALRLAPGIQVARVDANTWAVGVRGFASPLTRSVLVLIDGRSVYNPLFAGTYWDVQDTLLEDVDRIEIIRGPGGTLWGANAFNGVINIITKTARETQGGYLTGGGGSPERVFGGVRYGGQIGQAVHYRGYAKGFDREGFYNPDAPDDDSWRMGRGGFRLDWDAGTSDAVTLQGDVYGGTVGERIGIGTYRPPFLRVVSDDTGVSGGNLLGRWTRVFSETSDLSLQVYYDSTYRDQSNFTENRNTGDLDLQHRWRTHPWHELIWGLGFRVTGDQTSSPATVVFDPRDRTDEVFSAFLQSEISLLPERLRFIAGSKFEHNDYSGFEVQPNARLLWTPSSLHTVWGAVSRAVRTPSRVEDDLALTFATPGAPNSFTRILGSKHFDAERVLAYEVGYRVRPHTRLFLDAAAFYNDYDDLLSLEPGTPFSEDGGTRTIIPLRIENRLHGQTYGAEIGADLALASWWRLSASYAYLEMDLRPDADSGDTLTAPTTDGSSPRHQAVLRSLATLPRRVTVDTTLRYVDVLPAQDVDSYLELDTRIAWRPREKLELSVVGQNLVHDHHPEFGGGIEVPRGAYGQVRWWW